MRDIHNELQLAIEHETCRVIALRFQLENERRSRMAIEIKGLKAKALAARANLAILNTAYDSFNDKAMVHAADVFGLSEQLTHMQSDLEFAATVMGNSAGESEKLAQTSSEKPATTDRVALGPHPDQPEAMPDTTEGAIWVKKPVIGNAAKAYDEAVKFAEVEQKAAATFRAAE